MVFACRLQSESVIRGTRLVVNGFHLPGDLRLPMREVIGKARHYRWFPGFDIRYTEMSA